METSSADWAIRAAAFRQVKRWQEAYDQIPADEIAKGFIYDGERLPIVNPRRGIFKPRRMECLLSIKTVYPKPGARVWYDDQRNVHEQIYAGEETVEYAFMGKDPDAAENRLLKDAMHRRVPIIYFLGVAPGKYQAFVPTFITGWHEARAVVDVAFSESLSPTINAFPKTKDERRYALKTVKHRLHQSSFRAAVLDAYRGRCALSNLPEQRLLDAAHIVGDADADFGHPVVQNGLPLTKIHHAAFDAHLIGVDADFRVHVSQRLLAQRDGPLLQALQALDGRTIQLPARKKDRPDQDRLAHRFKEFLEAA